MARYILRRLLQSALTILGVMVITFLLFRLVSGDIAAANLGEKAPEGQKAAWRHRHGYDLPLWINWHRQLIVIDRSVGAGARPLSVKNAPGSLAADALALILSDKPAPGGGTRPDELMGRRVFQLSRQTPLEKLTGGNPMVKPPPRAPEGQAASAPSPATASAPTSPPAAEAGGQRATATSTQTTSVTTTGASAPAAGEDEDEEEEDPGSPGPRRPIMIFTPADGTKLEVDLSDVETCGDVLDRINNAPGNDGRLEATISQWSPGMLFDSQFFHHLVTSATFQARSLKDNRKLTDIIAERGPASLALQVPAFALEWLVGLVIACFVAYYRDSAIDKVGVFLTVLGMCIPFLAFMIYGQWLMFELAPRHAFGVVDRANVYVPIAIMVIAGLGSQVRFYRTIILDETNRDYVRTARAKGLPLTSVLFKHVLRNCMLPILTSLILSIPFLIMGGLLVERYFGIPGLGDLMLTSYIDCNEPIMSALVFLTALIYTLGVLVTDICYAIFDPRIRLR